MKKLSDEALKALQQFLVNNPHREKVYFNENGEYLTHETKGFDEVKSRDEILKGFDPEEGEDSGKKGKKKVI